MVGIGILVLVIIICIVLGVTLETPGKPPGPGPTPIPAHVNNYQASGVFFDLRKVDNVFAEYLSLNPIAALLSIYRSIMLDTVMPSAADLAVPVTATLLFGVAGLAGYRYVQPRLAKALLR